METYDYKKVAALNTSRYKAVPIQEHLEGLNSNNKLEQALRLIGKWVNQ